MDGSTGTELIAVPLGRVTLSDRRTQRNWPVEVAPYQLAAFPVTQARYAQVTGRRPSAARGDKLPVEGVSWWDAVGFCNALSQREGLTPAYRVHADDVTGSEVGGIEWDASADGYRLPTEAEWEHACRAGTTGPRYGPGAAGPRCGAAATRPSRSTTSASASRAPSRADRRAGPGRRAQSGYALTSVALTDAQT